ncbi:MAG: CotH kinase family protein [gamma proteobacterium symbiont of Taylorina sp.]|nr:CotH kinase family protein [gamma proteobacterium symbiont of Taylorina sp.]
MNQFKKIIIASLIITLPVSILFLIVSINTIFLFFQFKEFVPHWAPQEKIIYRIAYVEYLKLKNSLSSDFTKKNNEDPSLIIKNKLFNQLIYDLPDSGYKNKSAFLFLDNDLYKGKLRLRGDNYYHWLFPNKSWRFKTSRKKLINGMHKLNFIIPKENAALNNHMSYKLASQLGLLTPESQFVNLYINGQSNGLKLMIPQIDESFLRKNKRMPNDIYKGDNMGSKKILGAKINVFDTPSIWEKASYNNHYLKDERRSLEKLLLDKDYSFLDIDSFARFSFFIDMINSYHFDDSHNWIFYYDNYYEKMYPIIWDTLGWWEGWDKKHNVNIASSLFLKDLYSNYEFLYKKYEIAYDYFSKSNHAFIDVMNNEITTLKNKINMNQYSLRTDARKMNTAQTLAEIDLFKIKISDRLSVVKDYFLGDVKPEDYAWSLHNNHLRIAVNGSKMITKVIVKTKNNDKPEQISLYYLSEEQKVIKSSSKQFVVNNNLIEIRQNLLAMVDLKPIDTTPWHYADFNKASYDFAFDGMDINNIDSVSLEFLNLTKQRVKINRVKNTEIEVFKNAHNVFAQTLNSTPLVWRGDQFFSGFNTIKSNIIIESGSRIIMDKNATLKLLGKVTALGTKENPIIFQAKDKTKPWNAIVLKDEKANGSIFKHCIFKDGSGDKGDLYEYTAMLSIHNVKELLIEDCAFYDSHRTDDMVHAIYSDVTFKNTSFVNSLSDALDVDISNLVVDHCEFIDSGNDAIDLMTSNAIVSHTRFINSADKGISIGEGSNLLAANNVIRGNEVGMQSKDTSKAYIYNATFSGNKTAVDAYHKNWRYSEGGSIFVENSVFKNNIDNATVGKKSKIVINNSAMDTVDMIDADSLLKKKIIISHGERIMPQFDNAFFTLIP